MTGVAGGEYSVTSDTVDYLSEADMTVDCASGVCPTGRYAYIQATVCGNKFGVANGARFSPLEYPVDISFSVPYATGLFDDKDAPCSVGKKQVKVEGNVNAGPSAPASGTGELTVNSKGSMDNHVGEYLYYGLRDDTSPNRLNNFFLSNTDPGYENVNPNYAGLTNDEPLIVYDEHSATGSTEGATRPKVGSILKDSETTKLNSIAKLTDSSGQPICTHEGGGVNDAFCSIGENNFGTGNNIRLSSSDYHTSVSDISPVHSDAANLPDGEIAVAYYPEYYDVSANADTPGSNSESGPYFFVCRPGATMDNGAQEVDQVIDLEDSNQDLYQCNPGQREWNSVNECEDNIDNDKEDKLIDDNDPGCNTGDTEDDGGTPPPGELCYPGESSPCTPEFTCNDAPLATESPSGITYAFYESGGSCEFTEWSKWDRVGTQADGSKYLTNPDEFSCDYSQASSNEKCPPEDQWSSDWINKEGSMPVVEYGALPRYFDLLANATDRNLTTQGVPTGFVEQNTGWVSQTQGLHTAERRYDIDQIGTATSPGGINEGNCGSGSIEYSGSSTNVDCESYEWWDKRNLEDAKLNYKSSFNNDRPINRKGSWDVANAGSASKTTSITSEEDYVFKGGWVGECGMEDWGVTGDSPNRQTWQCLSTTPVTVGFGGGGGCCTDGGIEIPNFGTSAYLPDTDKYNDGGVEKREIGVIQFPYINQEGSLPGYIPADVNSYRNLVGDVNGDGNTDEITQLRAECWAGGTADKPADIAASDRAFHKTASPKQNDVWGVSGEVETEGLSGYACYWGYEVDERPEIVFGTGQDDVVHLHRNQQPGTSYYEMWAGDSSEGTTGVKAEYNLEESYGKGELSTELS